MPRLPLSSLPASTRPRFAFLEPTTFFATFPSWPGYCSLLCFLTQQHQPWQCLQGVQDDRRHHQTYVIFFHAFLVWGSTMHPAGHTSMVPGHAASFAVWELVQSSTSQIYVHPRHKTCNRGGYVASKQIFSLPSAHHAACQMTR